MSSNQFQRLHRLRQQADANLVANSRRQREAASSAEITVPATIKPFRKVTSSRNLRDTALALRSQGIKAPGPDNVRWDQVSRGDLCRLMHELSDELRQGEYFPSAARISKQPKRLGGTRDVTIRSILFKVVAKAIQESLQPYFEQMFLPRAFGSRTGLGVPHLLLALEAEIIQRNQPVVFQADIYHAFDFVPIDAVIQCYRRHVQDEPLLALIERNLRGTRTEPKSIGVDQGAADSSLALRILLHERVDLLYDSANHPPVFEYVDNFVGAASSRAIAQAAIEHTDGLLKPLGMAFKPQNNESIVDLSSGGVATVLGFQLRLHEGGVRYSVAPESLTYLRHRLLETHEHPNPQQLATRVVRGWLEAFGPAYELQAEEIIGQVREACLAAGFREFSWSMIPSTIARSLERWRKLRSRPLQPRIVSDVSPPSVTLAVAPTPQTAVSGSEAPW